MKKLFFASIILLPFSSAFCQAVNLQKTMKKGDIVAIPGSDVQLMRDGNKKGITIKNNVWFKDIVFRYGTIEVDIRGRNEFLHSFPGIAFHAADTSKNYDIVYFRPFNFRHSDPVRRTWSVQYMSLPDYSYERLRKENKGQFESEILPNPKPDDWIHTRIVIGKDSVKVYVNGMAKPSLSARKLQNRDKGMIGLWVDMTTADFVNLVITRNK